MAEKVFKTDNLALCPFLMLNGMKYLKAEIAVGKNDKPVVCFVFEDLIGIGRDLEIEFVRSDFKKYRDLSFFFRNEIEKLKRRMDKLAIEESKKFDDKYADEHNKQEEQ